MTGRLERWLAMLAADEAPHEYSLDAKPGEFIPAAPPYPDLTVVAVTTTPVQAIVLQTVHANATVADEGASERVVIARLVAKLEGGGEVEIQRLVAPDGATAMPDVDLGRCAACERRIIDGEAQVVGAHAYHAACLK